MRAKKVALVICGVYFTLAGTPRASAYSLSSMRNSVFRIQVMRDEPSFVEPWKRVVATPGAGSGFYIGDGRILTNAHVVANASFLTVQRDGDTTPLPARIIHIAHDADLAVIEPLEVAGKAALKAVRAMHLGGIPKLRSPVSTIGFPMGGDQLSVTDGIVSRISYLGYVHHGAAKHLLVQVDSAINPGNSGGPVVQGDQVVGVAFQSFQQAENTGYIIPTPVIRRFLRDIEDGRYDGHPEDGITVSDWALLNPSTQAFYRLSASDGGVKVAHVSNWASPAGLIRPGDLLLAIDHQPIGVDGRVDFGGERVDFRVLYDLKQMGDDCRFSVLREGVRRDVIVRVGGSRPHHEPGYTYARHPRYFVYGGLVFTALSRNLLRTWGERWLRDAPMTLRYLESWSQYDPDFADLEQIIVLVKRLPDQVNAYATGQLYQVVRAVDGQKIHNIKDLAMNLENGQGPYAVIDFFGSHDPIVMSRAQALAHKPMIEKRYNVTVDRWLGGDNERADSEAH